MKRKILSLFMVLTMLVCLLPTEALAAEVKKPEENDFIVPVQQLTEVPTGYTGIYTTEQLKGISNRLDGKYILMDDLELGSWTPIGGSTPFTGVFDGNGHSLSDLTINYTLSQGESANLGLFGIVENAEIRNVKVSGDISVTCPASSNGKAGGLLIGGITGEIFGSAQIDNCVTDVDISAEQTITSFLFSQFAAYGGIAGTLDDTDDTTISHCRNTGDISAYSNVGGIMGNSISASNNINIFACLNQGSISATIRAGGILGLLETALPTGKSFTISSCANEGSITTKELSGGILGECENWYGPDATVQDCLNVGPVKCSSAPSDAGGITGKSNIPVLRCVNVGTVSGAPAGAIQGRQTPTFTKNTLSNCYWLDTGRSILGVDGDGALVTDRTGALSAAQMKQAESFSGLDFEQVWILTEDMDYPYPSALLGLVLDNMYEITYVKNTKDDVANSRRFVYLMSGSGDGSLAGALGEAYEGGLRFWNSGWEIINYLGEVANFNFEFENDYDVMVADLMMGVCGGKDYEQALSNSVLKSFSELATHLNTSLDAVSVLQAEEVLTDFAELPDVFNSEGAVLVNKLRQSLGTKAGLETISKAITVSGGVINIASSISQNAYDLIDYYVLCEAYTNATQNFGDILLDLSAATYSVKDEKGNRDKNLRSSLNSYVTEMEQYALNDPALLYNKLGGTLTSIGMAGAGAAAEVACTISKLNPFLAGMKTGLNYGAMAADSLTNMDSVEYYGKLLYITGYAGECMFKVVQDYQNAFADSGEYEDAERLNTATDLYLALQVLACDYAINYCTAIASSKLSTAFNANMDDVASSIQLLVQKAELEQLREKGQDIYINPDGAIYGFIANCPVTVIVETKNGREVARLATGEKTVDSSIPDEFSLLGDNQECKAGFFDSSLYNLRIEGEDNGSMDLLLFSAKDGVLSGAQTFVDVPVSQDSIYTPGKDGLVVNGKTTIRPTSTYTPVSFTDVPRDAYYADAVTWAVTNGITKGTSDTTFSPNATCTRAQMVTFLWRAAGCPEPKSAANGFSDVVSGSYYEKAVQWAVEQGITKGTGDTTFSPEDTVTRAQTVTFLYRYMNEPNAAGTMPFTDVAAGSYYEDAVRWAVATGVTTGTGDGSTFSPDDDCIRAQTVTFLYRALVE